MADGPGITAAQCSAATVLEMFRRVPMRKIQIAASDDAAAIIQRGTCFAMQRNGETLGAYVLESSGPNLWITAAVGWGDVDLTGEMARLVDLQAAPFEAVMFRTRRRGLVHKARRLGYQVHDESCGRYIMRKGTK